MMVPSRLLFATRLAAPSTGRRGLALVIPRRLCSRPFSLLLGRHSRIVSSPKWALLNSYSTSTPAATSRHFQSQAGTEPGLDPNDSATDGDGEFLPQDAHTVYQVCVILYCLNDFGLCHQVFSERNPYVLYIGLHNQCPRLLARSPRV